MTENVGFNISPNHLITGEDEEMTLIIGARCKDGVVLVSDKKVIEGSVAYAQEKIKVGPLGVAFCGAGLSDLFEKFVSRLYTQVEKRKLAKIDDTQKTNTSLMPQNVQPYHYTEEFLTDCETLLKQLSEEYRDVITRNKEGLEILVAFGTGALAELHYMDIFNALDSKRNTYIAIGSGAPLASLFLKECWNEDLSMEEMAILGEFIINYIEKAELDSYVGKGTQIFWIPDLDKNYYDLLSKAEKEKRELNDNEKKTIQKYTPTEVRRAKQRNIDEDISEFRKGFTNLAKKLELSHFKNEPASEE